MKKKIFLFADWYAPGYKAGGPIRSCVNFTQNLKADYEIYVFTSDRDLGSDTPYEGIAADSWIAAEPGVHLYYSSPGGRGLQKMREQIRQIAPDFIYLNSMFSLAFTLLPLYILRNAGAARPRVVLSPRGMLRASALRFKPLKKKVFLKAFRLLGFPSIIRWHATDEEEQKDIRLHFGAATSVSLIPNLPAALTEEPAAIGKSAGELAIIFVGRIHPIKNLDYLLQAMMGLDGKVLLTIVGSKEDKVYWQHCEQLIQSLPPSAKVDYLGEVPNEQISGLIKKHHIFALPTQGENFGHAIFESLGAGRPVLISDQTPWKELAAARAGWELALADTGAFTRALTEALSWDQAAFGEWSAGAFAFANAHQAGSGALEKYRQLFL